MPLTFFWVFLVLMAGGIPIVFALAAGPLAGFLLADQATFMKMLPQRMFGGIAQFPILAIPLFILAGEVMNVSGITKSLVNFANVLIGHVRAGLAQANIAASIMFAGLSGSAVADTSALGSIFIPAMEKDGYSRAFAAAVTAASSVIGPIIPPSIVMVIYAYVMNVSVAALFLAGIIPGVMVGAGLMIVTAIIGKRRNYPKAHRRAATGEVWTAFKPAFLPLMTPIIILGGIVSGIVTPTEAAGAAVFYALVLSMLITRTVKPADLIGIFYRTGPVTGLVSDIDAYGPLAIQYRLAHLRAGHDPKVGTAPDRVEIGHGGAAPSAIADGKLIKAHAFLRRPVDVVICWIARLLCGLDPGVADRMGVARIGDSQRPVAPAKRIRPALVALGALEIGQYIVPAPAGIAHLPPAVEIFGLATHVEQAIQRRRAAQHLAAWPIDDLAIEARHRLGLVTPVIVGVVHGLEIPGRHVDPGIAVAATGLDQ